MGIDTYTTLLISFLFPVGASRPVAEGWLEKAGVGVRAVHRTLV